MPDTKKCSKCGKPFEVSPEREEYLRRTLLSEQHFCDACLHSGIAEHELSGVDEETRKDIDFFLKRLGGA